ncbi:vitamin B12 transporter BtuB [Cellvibrio zantedeschiae]|uniref:Vitamin B12 transporter BtuB n=1 Tax=Cellvibrio zantedeschiae TaxID=1237077 RepID=A0ABQ3B150_9GAMM|nr:TonB-dependent receptor [Cellvibrio zantedeschiae]GGY74462.1 vitamin B12 transporter BtuB [Cellvibrio zantedeschiae]
MKLKTLPLLISTLIATQVFAATDEVVVTGTYSPVTSEQLASSVTVISQEQLAALSSHSLVDALRQVPSIWVEEQGGPGGLTAIALRGAEANHTLVLLDGVQLNDPTNTRGGAFDVNNINIDSIKRIEIIRGAQSAIYGSDALAGVIHIITVEATETAQQNLSVAVGEDGYKTASLTATGTAGNLGYAVKVQGKDAGEPIEGSSAENKEALVKLNWKQDAHNLDFSYRYLDGEKTTFPEQSGGSLFAQLRDLDQSEFTDQNAALAWQWQVNDFWRSKLQGAWFNRQENLTSPGIVPFDAVPANGADTDFTRTNFSWTNTLGNEKSVWGNIGVETKHESGDSVGYLDFGFKMPTDFSLDRRIDSVFVNINGYINEDLLVQASARRDDAENLAPKDSVQGGVRYQINDNLSWFANAGQGFKLPSFLALGHPLVGNKNLKPERATTRDTGLEWSANNTSINFSVFRNTYLDLIDFDAELFTNVNRNQVDTRGVETEIHWHSQDNQWQLGAHASYADIDAENPLMGRPQVKAGATATYNLNDSWQFNANYLWVDDRLAASRYTGDTVVETLDKYNRFDLGAKWTVNSQLTINLSIENITDEDYMNDIGFPAIGRTGFVGANFSF